MVGLQLWGFCLALISVLCSSAMSLFVKLSTSASIPTLVFARFALGVPFFLWIVKRNKIDLSWKKVPKNLTRSIAGILALYSYYFALHTLPLVNAITLSNTAPLFMPILYLVWRQRLVSKRRILAVVVGFLGVLIILRPSATEFFVLGSLFGLFSGLCRAVALYNIRTLAKEVDTQTILTYYFFIGAVLSFFPLFLDWKPIHSSLQWFYVFLAGAFALGFQYFYTKTCAYLPSMKVASMNYLSVVFGGLLGWWILGEIPDQFVLVGTLLIICGALIVLTESLKKP